MLLSCFYTDILVYAYSGEKTSTKEWPLSLEIKGRVRIDAFEKFLQELPMSRTRAVMVYKGLLLSLVTKLYLLSFWASAFCLQKRQCSLPLPIVNDIDRRLVFVWLYYSSADEKYIKRLFWLCECFSTALIFLDSLCIIMSMKIVSNGKKEKQESYFSKEYL